MNGQHCENYDVKRETVHCYPRNVDRCCTWPDVVDGISARFSKSAFVLFCYITNRLMTGPLGNSEFCFPRISMFPSTSSRETLRFSGNKIHCSPQDQSLSVKYNMSVVSIPMKLVPSDTPYLMSLSAVCPILTSLATVISTVNGVPSSKTPASTKGTFKRAASLFGPSPKGIWSVVMSCLLLM